MTKNFSFKQERSFGKMFTKKSEKGLAWKNSRENLADTIRTEKQTNQEDTLSGVPCLIS